MKTSVHILPVFEGIMALCPSIVTHDSAVIVCTPDGGHWVMSPVVAEDFAKHLSLAAFKAELGRSEVIVHAD